MGFNSAFKGLNINIINMSAIEREYKSERVVQSACGECARPLRRNIFTRTIKTINSYFLEDGCPTLHSVFPC